MKTFLKTTLLVIFTFLIALNQVNAQGDIFEELDRIAIVDQKVMVPMRDGIRLATDIYRPKTDKKGQEQEDDPDDSGWNCADSAGFPCAEPGAERQRPCHLQADRHRGRDG